MPHGGAKRRHRIGVRDRTEHADTVWDRLRHEAHPDFTFARVKTDQTTPCASPLLNFKTCMYGTIYVFKNLLEGKMNGRCTVRKRTKVGDVVVWGL
jgi:hypothetical protein